MKTISFFALIALTIGHIAAQRPNDNNGYPDNQNGNRSYNNQPNNGYSDNQNGNRGYNNQPNYNNPTPNCNNLSIDELQRTVYFKINNGIENGSLNRREAQYLSRAFGDIEQKGRYFRADGFLSRQEENELRYDLMALNDQVRYEKHDNDYSRNNSHRDNRNRGRRWGW
jgi:hypothetical protein